MKKVCFIIVYLGCLATGFAQDIEVKKFEQSEKDQTAVTSPRKDLNGNTCGLVKVALKEAGAEFEGNVMGDVEFTGKEYLVYIPNGTKRLSIKHPDYLPTTVVFADYGTKRVSSGTTYELKVKTNKKKAKVDNSKKGMAVFNIKPSNTMLLIDGQIADGSGGAYTLSLPYGTHYYTVKLKDFSINNQIVKIDKNAKTVNMDLTEFFAKVDVACRTTDAEIFVNGEQKGIGKWEGYIVPGKCTIEARKEGFHLLSKTIELVDSEESIVRFMEMKPITGILRVENVLDNCEVFLNGEKVGTTPWKKELPIGEYNIEIRHNYFNPVSKSISLSEGQDLLIKEELTQTILGRLNQLADIGHSRARRMMADLYKYGAETIVNYPPSSWNNDCFEDDSLAIGIETLRGERIEKDIMEEIKWAKIVAMEEHDMCSEYWLAEESFHLMERFLVGEDIKQDFSQSFYWAKVGANDGYWNRARLWLAWHYYFGKGVKKDENLAHVWLNKYDSKYKSCSGDLLKKLVIDDFEEYIKFNLDSPIYYWSEGLDKAVLNYLYRN